jgi:hypothetical protein
MIIGINGKIGSGKDTIGKIIQYLTANEEVKKITTLEEWLDSDDLNGRDFNWKIKKFAGKLKQIASLLTGISVEKFEDQEFKKTYLGKEWNSPYNIPFSGPDFVKHDGEATVREFLQRLGTEAMRDGLHTNVWVNALFADYKDVYIGDWGQGNHMYEKPNWIITDMRFPNEMEAVVEKKGITIRVSRHPINLKINGEMLHTTQEDYNTYVTKRKEHPSETALDDTVFDYEIENNGSIEDLVEKVREILIKENII